MPDINLEIWISVDLSSSESCHWSNGCHINVSIRKEKQINSNTAFYTFFCKFLIKGILWSKYCLKQNIQILRFNTLYTTLLKKTHHCQKVQIHIRPSFPPLFIVTAFQNLKKSFDSSDRLLNSLHPLLCQVTLSVCD